MIANALFYTFSTISQTLAGAIALLGAFVLYRLQSLTQKIDEESDNIASRYTVTAAGQNVSHRQAIRGLHDEQRYREVLAFVTSTPPPPDIDQATRERTNLLRHLNHKDALLKVFRISLYLTVGLIVVSVGALALAPALMDSSCAIASLVVAVAWFTVCMVSYGVLVHRALE